MILNYQALVKELTRIKQKSYLLKMNWKYILTFDSNHFIGQSYFNNDGVQLYLIFQPRFEGSCLKQEDTAPFTPNNVVNLFIVYKLDSWLRDADADFTLGGC